MKRIIKEQISFTGEEKGKYDFVVGMLFQLCKDIEQQENIISSSLYNDTKHLIMEMDRYIKLYYRP